MKPLLRLTLWAGVSTFSVWAAAPADSSPAAVRAAAAKAAGLMEKSMAALTPNVPCASCHHNMIPLWALSVARDHGVPVNRELFRNVALRTYSYLNDVDRAAQGTQYVDPALEGAEQLAFAKDNGVRPTFTAALHTARLARAQRQDGRWVTFDSRPPQSYSQFMTTALSAKAVLEQSSPVMKGDAASRVERAREWLLRTQAVSTEDATFKLLGLYWTGAASKQVQAAAKALMAMQRAEDGGWTQVPGRGEPDAYATGEAAAALQITGMAKAGVAVSRGIAFLLKTQAEDGSWQVKTRLHEAAPISPPYMETGFPYGKNQIMSMFGTTWALMALSYSLPEQKQLLPEIDEINPKVEDWMPAVAFGTIAELKSVDINAATAKGTTPLMLAVNNPARVAVLLDRGADVNAKAKSGHTALSVAATYGDAAPVMRLLIAKGGASAKPVKGVEYNSNPLVYSAFLGDVEAVKVLLDAGASAKQGMLLEGLVPMNPLMAAVATDSADVLSEFLRRGVDPNSVEDLPLLSWAAAYNRVNVARVLLQAGADPELKDKYGWTPLQHARAIEHDKPAVEAMIQAAVSYRKQPAPSGAGQ